MGTTNLYCHTHAQGDTLLLGHAWPAALSCVSPARCPGKKDALGNLGVELVAG